MDVKRRIYVKRGVNAVVRRGGISWLLLILALFLLTGCGNQVQDTSALPASLPPATVQPAISGTPGGGSASSEGGELSADGQETLDGFMAKVNEQLTLNDEQRKQVREAVQNFLIVMEMKAQQGQLGQGGQGRQSGGHPDPTDKEREEMAQMKQMGGPGQVTQQLQQVLSTDQLEVFQRLMEGLRQEMLLQRTIQQMGGTSSTSGEDK